MPAWHVAAQRLATSSTCFIDIPQSRRLCVHPLCLCATRALSRRARVPLRRTAAVSAPPGCPRGTSPRNGLPRRRPASARGAKAIMGAFWLAMTHERWRAETTCLSPRVVPLTSLPWARALARAAALPPMPRRCSQRGCLALAFHGALTTRGACGQYDPPSSAFRCSGFRYHPDTTMRRPQHCCVSQLPLTTPVQTASKNSKRLAINALERQLVCPDAGRRAVGDGISRRDLPRPVTDHNERPSAQSK